MINPNRLLQAGYIVVKTILPINNFVNYLLLLCRCSPKIDSGRLNTLMPHQVGEQCNIIISLQKVLGVSMSERVRVHNLWIQLISDRIILKLLGNTTRSYSVTKPIEEQIT